MGFSYKPLFKLLVERDMKKTDLHSEVGLSSATLAKLSKGEPLSGESIEKLCIYFQCQPGDLVKYELPEETASVAAHQRKAAHKRASAPKVIHRRTGGSDANQK